jgi:hypothetical protein
MTERDPESARQWLQKWEGVPEADGARRSYANALLYTDPPSAFEWASHNLTAPELPYLAQVAWHHLRKRDPLAADQWLHKHQLPASLTGYLEGKRKAGGD